MTDLDAPPAGAIDPLLALPALVEVDISGEWGQGYAAFVEDVLRMVCIQVTIQLMLYFSASDSGVAFVSTDFLLMLAYIVMGVALYWLVLKRIVAFK